MPQSKDSKQVKEEGMMSANAQRADANLDSTDRPQSEAERAATKVVDDADAQASADRKSSEEQEKIRQEQERRQKEAESRGERIKTEIERQEGVTSAGPRPEGGQGGIMVVNRTGGHIRVTTEVRSQDADNPGWVRDTLIDVGVDDMTVVVANEDQRVVIDVV